MIWVDDTRRGLIDIGVGTIAAVPIGARPAGLRSLSSNMPRLMRTNMAVDDLRIPTAAVHPRHYLTLRWGDPVRAHRSPLHPRGQQLEVDAGLAAHELPVPHLH